MNQKLSEMERGGKGRPEHRIRFVANSFRLASPLTGGELCARGASGPVVETYRPASRASSFRLRLQDSRKQLLLLQLFLSAIGKRS